MPTLATDRDCGACDVDSCSAAHQGCDFNIWLYDTIGHNKIDGEYMLAASDSSIGQCSGIVVVSHKVVACLKTECEMPITGCIIGISCQCADV